jgi:asparagine synthase (glutamine-hydrolysing)
LLPGHALTLDANGKRRDFTHGQVDFLRPKKDYSEEEWLERITEALKVAIRRRLIADVPIGVLLSGGVDSSLVTALAAEICPRVRTFSVATEDPELDERQFSKAVADRWGTDHHELEVGGDFRRSLCRLVGAMGEPLADASAANVFAIAEKAREMVTVVLTGDGGDEAFGGYHHFLGYYLAERARKFLVRPALPLLAATGRSLSKTTGRGHQAGTFLQMTASPVSETLFAFHSAMSSSIRSQLYTSDFEHELGGRLHNEHYVSALPRNGSGAGSWDVDRVMQAYMVTTLPDDYLAKVDSGTMAMSLEARSPFLDVDLLEMASSIPAPMRFRRAKAKSLLRSLALRYLPRECVQRRKKGFAAPIHVWLRGDWQDLVEEFVLGPQVKARGWFRPETLQRVVAEHARGIDHSDLIWGLLILELWMRLSVEGSLSPTDAL